MSCLPRRKGRRECGLVIGEAVIGAPATNPTIYITVTRVIHYFSTENVF